MTALRRLLLLVVAIGAAILVSAATASAHNSLESSNPADGSTVETAPTQLVFVFANAVPLETYSAEYIDATGVRNELTGSTHGPSGDTEVVTPLPPLPAGEVTVRWRLVGPDGHPITGRVTFTIAQSAVPTTAATPVPAPTTTLAGAAPVAPTPTTQPTAPAPAPATPATITAADGGGGFDEPWTTPDAMRWIFRMASYLAVMAVGGIIATSALVWPDAWNHLALRRLAAYSLVVAIALAFVQLVVIASDIAAAPPLDALGELSAAFETDAGIAFAVRIAVLTALAGIVFWPASVASATRWKAAAGCILAALGTWAYAGHSQSMRWSFIGLPLDIAHHAAAAAWVGGLTIVGLVAMRHEEPQTLVEIVQKFSRVAAVSVAVIVATGALQALRLIGSPTNLLAADHGRYLLIKLAAIVIMLKLADVNRRRVNQRFQRTATATPEAIFDLRRAMGIEMFVGIAIIGVTAVMVVSPPATATETSGSPTESIATP